MKNFLITLASAFLLITILVSCSEDPTPDSYRLTKRSYFDESDVLQDYYVYEYDAIGNRIKHSRIDASDVLQNYYIYEYIIF